MLLLDAVTLKHEQQEQVGLAYLLHSLSHNSSFHPKFLDTTHGRSYFQDHVMWMMAILLQSYIYFANQDQAKFLRTADISLQNSCCSKPSWCYLLIAENVQLFLETSRYYSKGFSQRYSFCRFFGILWSSPVLFFPVLLSTEIAGSMIQTPFLIYSPIVTSGLLCARCITVCTGSPKENDVALISNHCSSSVFWAGTYWKLHPSRPALERLISKLKSPLESSPPPSCHFKLTFLAQNSHMVKGRRFPPLQFHLSH